MKNQYKFFTIIILISSLASAQSYQCQEKLLNCKEMVINGFKNNDVSFTNKLSDELVQMQQCDPTLGAKFTSWYDNFVANYKTEINNELEQLQREKQSVKDAAEEVRVQSINNSNIRNQQLINQARSNSNSNSNKSNNKTNNDDLHPFGAGSIR